MSERYVKTADLPPGTRPRRWVFCGTCYGNHLNAEHKTTDPNGDVCPTCDGTGTLWMVEATHA